LASLVSLAAMSFGQVPTVGAILAPPNQIEVSDQKPGSILVWPYYTSNAQTKADTRLTLTNLGTTDVIAHLFFLNGANCQQADQFVCLTKGASIAFKASEQDPEITGYMIAVAVNAMGQPIHRNQLIGNAFVNAGDYYGNYGAEALAAADGQIPGVPGIVLPGANPDGTHTLNLNGIIYDRAADQFAVEIQSPADAAGQAIVHASLAGNIATAAVTNVAQAGTGLVIRGDEKQGSFVGFIGNRCHTLNTITATSPRVPTGLGVFIAKGSIGTLVYNTNVASVGLLLTPKTNAWGGIRGLHKTRTVNSTLTIPVFMPVC
jgi:hypothetical protein